MTALSLGKRCGRRVAACNPPTCCPSRLRPELLRGSEVERTRVDPAGRSALQQELTALATASARRSIRSFRRLWPLLRGFARRFLSAEEADDVAQEALLRIFRRASEFDPGRDAPAWVLGIVARHGADTADKGADGGARSPLRLCRNGKPPRRRPRKRRRRGRAHRGPGSGVGRALGGRCRDSPRLCPRRAPGLARGHVSQTRRASA